MVFWVSVPQAAWSVDQAVETAIRIDPGVAAARKERDAAQAGRRGARALTNPSVLASPALGPINGTTEEFLFTQPLELNGARSARVRGAEATVQLAQLRWESAVRDVVVAVRSAMVELWRERSLRDLAQDDLAAADAMDRLVRTQVDLGSRPGVDTARSGLEKVRATQRLALATGRLKAAQVRLASLLGQPFDGALPPMPEPSPIAKLPDLTQALRLAILARVDVRLAEADQRLARSGLDAVRADGRLDIAPQWRAQQLFSRQPRANDMGFSVAIRVPLIDWGGQRSRLASERASVAAAEDRVSAVRLAVSAEVVAAHARLEAALAVFDAVEPARREADRLLESVQKGFEEGAMALPMVLEARKARRETLVEAVEARAEAVLARIAWERTVGVGTVSEKGVQL